MSDENNTNEVEASNVEAENACPEGYTTITATVKKNGAKVESTFYYDFKGSVLAAAEAFGEKLVYDGFVRSAKIDAQGRMRALMEAGKNPEEVSANMTSSWFPGAKGLSTKEDLIESYKKLSEEERAALLEQLKAAL